MGNPVKTIVELSTATEDITAISVANIFIVTTIKDRNSNTGFYERIKQDGTFVTSSYIDKSSGRVDGLTVSEWSDTSYETDFVDGKNHGFCATYENGQLVELNQYNNGTNLGVVDVPDLNTVPIDDKRPSVLSNIKRRMEAGTLKL